MKKSKRLVYDESGIMVIRSKVKWNKPKIIFGTVVIDSGAELSVSGKKTVIQFADSKHSKQVTGIVVKPGGRLILNDRSRLTALLLCPHTMWDGIEVHGNPTASQNPFSNQGYVEMSGDAVIEHARYAIMLGKSRRNDKGDVEPFSSQNIADFLGGGVVRMNDAEIRNCLYGLWFNPYLNSINRSIIENSRFMTNQLTRDRSYVNDELSGDLRRIPMRAFVTERLVRRIKYYGNTFYVDNSNMNLQPDLLGTGIQAGDGSYIVENGTVFTGLYTGIDSRYTLPFTQYFSRVQNNTFSGVYRGIYGLECAWQNIFDNYMKDYEVGIELDNAQLPTQGVPDPGNPNVGEPWDNVWDHSDPANHLKVDGSLIFPLQKIIWYHQGNDNPSNPLSPRPFLQGLVDPRPYQTAAGAECGNQNLVGGFDRDKMLGYAVGDSAGFTDYANELAYLYKMYVYDLLRKNDTLLSLGNANDASFQQFFADLSETNIGLLDLVKQALDSNLTETAAARNEAVTDTNSVELARKTVFAILTNKILQELDMDAADTAALEFIFTQHWITAGKAVYDAAALLGKEYHSPAISLRKQNQTTGLPHKPDKTPLNKPAWQVTVLPNPAAEQITLTGMADGINTIELYDCTMRLVYRSSHTGSNAQVSMAAMSKGVYHLRISNHEGAYHNSRVVLIK